MLGLDNSLTNIFRNHEYQFNGQKFIDFTKLNMPQNVNIINGDIDGNKSFPVPGIANLILVNIKTTNQKK